MFRTYWVEWIIPSGSHRVNVYMSANDAVTSELMDAVPDGGGGIIKVRGSVINSVASHVSQLLNAGITSVKVDVMEFSYGGN